MKRTRTIILTICFLIVSCICAGYFLLAYYYREGFSLNTWINGVYCTGKTIDEVNSELLSNREAPIITIKDKDGTEYQMPLNKSVYSEDYEASLQQFMGEQNSLLWIDNLTFHREHSITPFIQVDEKGLQALWNKLEFVEQEREAEYVFAIHKTVQGYVLYDGLHERLHFEKAFESVYQAVSNGETYVDLTESDCYFDIVATKEEEEAALLWKKIADYQSDGIIYDMGDEQITLNAGIVADFLVVDEKGLPALDEEGKLQPDKEQVTAWVAELAEEYDTLGKERIFQSTRGDVITVSGGTYGNQLNQKKEVEYLMENLLSDVREIHIPTYKKECMVRGKNDIGDTYIEIDMTEQMLYYYVDGECKLETQVVTGNTSRKMGTPEGVNYVYNKQKNRILRGKGYASFVKFWMPVKGSIGIHDASWRSEFGGEIYRKNGSHGCINTPTEKMTELYDMVEIGTPVVMFY